MPKSIPEVRRKGKGKPKGRKTEFREQQEALLEPLGSPRLCIIINEARQSLLSVAAPEVLTKPGVLGSGKIRKRSSSRIALGESKKGNLEPFLQDLRTVGPILFEDEDIRTGLRLLWWQAQQGKDRQRNYYYPGAQEHLKQIGEALAWVGGGAPETLTEEERPDKRRTQHTEAQRRFAGRGYQDRMKKEYRKGKCGLKERGKLTGQSLRALKDRLIAEQRTPHTGEIKGQAIAEFDRWAEDDIAKTATMTKNSR